MSTGEQRAKHAEEMVQFRRRNAVAYLEYQRAWKAANREKVKAASDRYYAKNRDAYLARLRTRRAEAAAKAQRKEYGADYYWNKLPETQRKKRAFNSARANARAKSREFTVKFEEIVWPEFCPIFGVKLNYGLPKGKSHSDDSPSIDRHDPSKGYVPGNCVVMSWRANRIKTDATLEEVHKLLEYLAKTRSN